MDERRERRQAEERKARLKAINLPPPMSARADLLEFLELFERLALRKELPKRDWPDALLPLLSEKFRSAAVKMPTEVQGDFEALKLALLERDETNVQDAAATFWAYGKKANVSALEERQYLLRLVPRFIDGDDKAAWTDALVRERIIHGLPKEGR